MRCSTLRVGLCRILRLLSAMSLEGKCCIDSQWRDLPGAELLCGAAVANASKKSCPISITVVFMLLALQWLLVLVGQNPLLVSVQPDEEKERDDMLMAFVAEQL